MTVAHSEKLKKVLLIDDNEIDNFLNQTILKICGATNILTFTSPIDALQHLRQTVDVPKLILLDIRLPIMDGFEFLDMFHQLEIEKESIDIFILTCSVNPADKEKAHQKKCAFIEKPLTTEKLFTQLDLLWTKYKYQ